MSKFIYVDGENTTLNEYLDLFDLLSDNDHLLIFHSSVNARITFTDIPKLMRSKVHYEFVKIKPGKKNALDFVLASYVGRFLFTEPDSKHYILSKDMGYDALCIHYSSVDKFVERIPDISYIYNE